MAALGCDPAELAKIAELYQPGATLWRVPIAHFTLRDYNYQEGWLNEQSLPPMTNILTSLFDATSRAHDSIRTLMVRGSGSCDNVALARTFARGASARAAFPNATRTYSTSTDESRDSRSSWSVWWEKPEHWRDEFAPLGGQATVAVVTERGSLVYLPWQQSMYTSMPVSGDWRGEIVRPPAGIRECPSVESRLREFPLLAPALPDSEWTFTTIVHEQLVLGRVARRVRATRRSSTPVERESRPSGYWLGVDEYECLVDDGLQLLLRMTGIDKGEPVASLWLDDVVVNEAIPADVFLFAPPPGTRITLAP